MVQVHFHELHLLSAVRVTGRLFRLGCSLRNNYIIHEFSCSVYWLTTREFVLYFVHNVH